MTEHFASNIYFFDAPQFLSAVKEIADNELSKLRVVDKMFPILQTGTLFDSKVSDFATYVAQTAWNILNDQGYDMDNYSTVLEEMWAQQLNMRGMHVEHVHTMGAQISGFYFLETPENSSKPFFNDPNHAKRQINLPQRDESKITAASTAVNYDVTPGQLILFNSWLPHGFGPNASSKPFKFVHFNVNVYPVHNHIAPPPAADEVV
jgi:uncharacterized protein (TIGR02466 family)